MRPATQLLAATLIFSILAIPCVGLAQWGQLMPYAGVSENTTFNPSDKSSIITLSNGNLTATSTAASNASVRATAAHSTGKYYFELTSTSQNDGGYNRFGIATSSYALTSLLGADANSVGMQWASGFCLIYYDTSELTGFTCSQPLSGNIGEIAIDLGGKLYWYRIKGGNWNNNGSANPATGTDGVSFSSFSGSAFPAWSLQSGSTPNDNITVNFGKTPFSDTPPSGFGKW